MSPGGITCHYHFLRIIAIFCGVLSQIPESVLTVNNIRGEAVFIRIAVVNGCHRISAPAHIGHQIPFPVQVLPAAPMNPHNQRRIFHILRNLQIKIQRMRIRHLINNIFVSAHPVFLYLFMNVRKFSYPCCSPSGPQFPPCHTG